MIAKKMMKKLLSIMAAIIICMGTATCVQAADEDFVVDGSGVLTGYTGNGGDITIPSTVSRIDDGAFADPDYTPHYLDITSVVIPSNVTSIGASAFSGCNGLKSVTIKGASIDIETNAFNSCPLLRTITIESTSISVGTNAFNSIATDATFKVQNDTVRDKIKVSGFAQSYTYDVVGNTPTPTSNPGSGSGGGSGLPNTSAEDRSHFHLIVFCSLAALTACTYGLKRRFSDV